MSCEGCHQELKAAEAARSKAYQEAKTLAKETGKRYGLYRDEFGTERYVVEDLAGDYPQIYGWCTPYM